MRAVLHLLLLTLLPALLAACGGDVRAKGLVRGDPELEVWLDAPLGPRPLDPEAEVVMAGDRVQLRYRGSRRTHLSLLGRDETGAVEYYGTWPADPTPGWHATPVSLVLDNARGMQWLYVVYTDGEPDRGQVVQDLTTGSVPAGAMVETVGLHKSP